MSKLTDRILGGLLVALIAAALIGGLYEASRGESEATRGLIPKGSVAPPFLAVRHSDKKPVSSDALRGRVVVLNFWGTWCPHCVDELPAFRSVVDRYAGQPVEILALDDEQGAEDPPAVVEEFLTRNRLSGLPVAYPEPSVEDRYGIRAFPTTYVIGKDGKVLFRHVGAMTESRLREEIDSALKG